MGVCSCINGQYVIFGGEFGETAEMDEAWDEGEGVLMRHN